MKKIGLVLFTSDLRLHDNTTLMEAIRENDEILPVFCWNESYMNEDQFGFLRMGDLRRGFLTKILNNLHSNLKSKGGYLLVKKGNQLEVIQTLLTHYFIQKVYTKKQVGIEEKRENDKLKKWLLSKGIDYEEYSTSTLYHPSDLPFSIRSIPEVFSKFRKLVESEAKVRKPLEAPSAVYCPVLLKDLQEINSINNLLSFDNRSSLPALGGEASALKLHF